MPPRSYLSRMATPLAQGDPVLRPRRLVAAEDARPAISVPPIEPTHARTAQDLPSPPATYEHNTEPFRAQPVSAPLRREQTPAAEQDPAYSRLTRQAAPISQTIAAPTQAALAANQSSAASSKARSEQPAARKEIPTSTPIAERIPYGQAKIRQAAPQSASQQEPSPTSTSPRRIEPAYASPQPPEAPSPSFPRPQSSKQQSDLRSPHRVNAVPQEALSPSPSHRNPPPNPPQPQAPPPLDRPGPPAATRNLENLAPPPRIHIGTVEVRLTAPPAATPPQPPPPRPSPAPGSMARPGTFAQAGSLAQPLAWRYGLVQS